MLVHYSETIDIYFKREKVIMDVYAAVLHKLAQSSNERWQNDASCENIFKMLFMQNFRMVV